MKFHTPFGLSRCLRSLAVVACSLSVVLPAAADRGGKTVDGLFREARVAYERGNYEVAEEGFRKILRQMPNHIPSRAYLKKVKDAKEAAEKVEFKDELSALVIKEVTLKNASLNEAVDYLRKKVPELVKVSDNPGLNVNFVVFARAEEADKETITELSLNNIPVTKFIDYVGRMSGFVPVYSDGIVELRPAER
ncbi:hypothetical protein [Sulfuriroseicoccus oceanibius]|uniref:Tetratricopeptide repeat protein n=1 Tax=Sulfuriroseicoccus oceanibius TaxID=2707525 RepID=A0A6B3L9L6_9BACT|nr:hypothetical protein [Sulfuriroseicoccus oceanibius]QQL46251.1 tetratricopeptide repeat protein [Sulfuriroseicoccus oceanibius]